MSARIPPVLLLLALALAVAGCGGDDEGKPIPSASATALNAELEGVQARLDNGTAGACKDILEGPRGPNRERVQQIIDSMPDDVDADVRSALEGSFDNLWDLVQQECDDKAQEEESQQQQQEEEPEPTPTEPTPTETTETETTPTETTPPATEELPPEGDGENGGGVPGNGNGNGNGNGVGGGITPDGANLGGGE
jgi:hypothetical protein